MFCFSVHLNEQHFGKTAPNNHNVCVSPGRNLAQNPGRSSEIKRTWKWSFKRWAVFIKSFPNVTSWKSEKPVAVHQHNVTLFAHTNNQSEHFKPEDKKPNLSMIQLHFLHRPTNCSHFFSQSLEFWFIFVLLIRLCEVSMVYARLKILQHLLFIQIYSWI